MENIRLQHWLIGIFTSIILIFAMSHNAGAVSFNLENYSVTTESATPRITCNVDNANGTSQVLSNVAVCSNWYNMRSFRIVGNYQLKQNDILSFYVVVNSAANTGAGTLFNNIASSRFTNLHLLDFKQIGYIDYTKAFIDGSQQGDNFSFYFDGVGINSLIYKIDLLSLSDHTEQDIVMGFSQDFIFQSQDSSALYTLKVVNLAHYVFQGSEENREQAAATQNAVDGSENAGNSSSQDAQSGTTGLLSAINGAISVITSASPTNCQINGNMGNLDIGQIDLCANPVPAFIQTIGSLLLILMCVPLAISLFNRFIALFRSFQS